MHAIAGLLELSRPEEALDYVNEIRGTSATFDQTLRTQVRAPQLVGLMLGKAAEAELNALRARNEAAGAAAARLGGTPPPEPIKLPVIRPQGPDRKTNSNTNP